MVIKHSSVSHAKTSEIERASRERESETRRERIASLSRSPTLSLSLSLSLYLSLARSPPLSLSLSLSEQRLSLIPVERVRIWTCGMFPACRWTHQEAFCVWSGFLIAQALCVLCVLQMSNSTASPMAASSSSTASGRASGKATSFIPELQSMM